MTTSGTATAPRLLPCHALAGLLLLSASPATAQSPGPPEVPKPPPYSLPWLLRPIVPQSGVRIDETLAFYEDPLAGTSGSTYLTGLTVSYKASPRWSTVLRETFVRNGAPAGGPVPSGSGFSNPLLGIAYFHPLARGWRFTAFVASTIPVGAGGGDDPDKGAAAAMAAGLSARSQMDNALFATNYWTLIGGLGLARITSGLTLQAEATVLQLTRARGPSSQDGARTNLTTGLHAGCFLSPRISLGAEVRLQRWLTDAAPVGRDPAARQQVTFAFGPRFHFKVGKRQRLRPGVSYTRALDDPMAKRSYDILQIDAPLSF